jgi:AcrR family transcriptional regulator
VDALARDRLLDDAWAMLAGAAARVVARRLDAWYAASDTAWTTAGAVDTGRRGAVASRIPAPLLAPMLAGALVESVRWWAAHPGAASPGEVDVAFHQLARGILHRKRAGQP